jgi:hypothetical protein
MSEQTMKKKDIESGSAFLVEADDAEGCVVCNAQTRPCSDN